MDDRAVDLWSPLVAIALVANGEDDRSRARQLLDPARELDTTRDANVDAGPTARLLEAADLLGALQARAGWDWVRNDRPPACWRDF